MNVLYETNQRITYSNARLRDLHECLKKDTLTKDAESYLKDEIKKSKKNIQYYYELLQELEKGGEA